VTDTAPAPSASRLTAVLRGDDERVTPLELFFDLVFVLAITQCTALMAHEHSWAGIAKGLLVLGILWWAWVGYAWLTSTVDPEEGTVRLVIFGATAALLVAALCVPTAFDESAGIFAGAYAIVRYAQVWLLLLAARDDPGLRHSSLGLLVSTTIGCALIAAAALANGWFQGSLWALALLLDMGGPLFIDTEGWRLVPHHFAERHGLIVLIALGESVVAIGAGAGRHVDAGVVGAAVVGIAVISALWWLYFDVVALVAARRLVNSAAGGERNRIARDSFSYLHLPMVAGIVLVALGIKGTLAHTGAELHDTAAVALLGGAALYLLAHVAFRWRNVHRFSWQRLIAAALCGVLVPAALAVPALAALGMLAAVLAAVVAYENVRFAELRARLRAQLH
jgi:low temperature requirement protein LtrA